MNVKVCYKIAENNSLDCTTQAILQLIVAFISRSEIEHEGRMYCTVTQQHLANNLGCSVTTVKRSITKLVDLGYLIKERLKAHQWNQVNCYALGQRFDSKYWDQEL